MVEQGIGVLDIFVFKVPHPCRARLLSVTCCRARILPLVAQADGTARMT